MGLKAASRPRARRAFSRNGSTRATAQAWWRPKTLCPVRLSPRMAARSRKLSASMSSTTAASRCASALPWATNSPTTSPSGRTISGLPIPSCGPRHRSRTSGRRSAGRCSAGFAHPPRQGDRLRKAVPVRRAEYGHTIANLEAHHFKYALFRRPGDVHVHFFGTATLSFSDGIKTQNGDVFEIQSELFGLPLRNRLGVEKAGRPRVRSL